MIRASQIYFSPGETSNLKRHYFRLATLQPYPDLSGLRPTALRPILSGGLPLTTFLFSKCCTNHFYSRLIMEIHIRGDINNPLKKMIFRYMKKRNFK
jgi:hypothetical protein